MNALLFIPLFIGTTELILIGGLALLLFGGKKLPEMMRGLGQGVQNFKKGMNDPISENEEDKQRDNENKESESGFPQKGSTVENKEHNV